MILTVTLNAALDVTYRVERIRWGETNRVRDVTARGGGKGVNVARVLRALGEDAVVTGMAGGHTGQAIRDDLAAAGIPEQLMEIAAESRRTLVVAQKDRTIPLYEPGPKTTAAEWRTFLDRYRELLHSAEAVVLSGSLPGGVPAGAYATLAAQAGERGLPVVLDADGDALRLGLAARPTVAKPNRRELSAALGAGVGNPLEAAERLRRAGAGAVVVTLGEDGLVAATPDGCWAAPPPELVTGNPTGAGDAVAAALVLGLVRGRSWPDIIASAAAMGAAAARTPVAGEIDLACLDRCRRVAEARRL